MAEPTLPEPGDEPADDLPLAVRRERETQARERELRIESDRAALANEKPPAATVTHFDVPLGRLALFLLKATVAAVPALALVAAVLLLIGTLFGSVVQVQITIPPQATARK